MCIIGQHLFYIVFPAQPSATLVSMTSTTQCSPDYLLDSQDTTTITYEISGANDSYQFIALFGPTFYWSSNGMESAVSCYWYNYHNVKQIIFIVEMSIFNIKKSTYVHYLSTCHFVCKAKFMNDQCCP